MSAWEIDYKGVRQSVEKWSVENLQFRFVSQAADELTFRVIVPFDAARVFDYAQTVRVFKDGVQWFVGRIVKPRATATANSEAQEYIAVGPWYYLTEKVFEQPWSYWIDANHVKQTTYTSHIILNGTSDGLSLLATGEQIRRVLQWAIDGFAPGAAPFAIGEITPAILPPVDEIRDTACSEVIKKQLRWHPDAVTWFDYSKQIPTFNCKLYAQLDAVTLTLPSDSKKDRNIAGIQLESREDLMRPSVALKYEIRTTINDQERLLIVPDIAPAGATGLELSALVGTIDLQGGKVTVLTADIATNPIPSDLKAQGALDWWKSRVPELAASEVFGVEIVDTRRTWIDDAGNSQEFSQNGGADGLPVPLPNELMRGQITEWMPGIAQRERVTIKVRFLQYDVDPSKNPTAKPRASVDKQYTKEITTTDLETGVYAGPKRVDERGDPRPVGLAKALYDSLNILHWQGSFTLVEEEVNGLIRPRNVVNLQGAKAEWAGMRALVQQVIESVADGTTSISVGPPERLGPTDLIELLRVNRSRSRSGPPGAQGDGFLDDGGGGSLGKQTPVADRAPSNTLYGLLAIKNANRLATFDALSGVATFEDGKVLVKIDMVAGVLAMSDASRPGASITLDIARCSGRAVYIQETGVCETINGVQTSRKALVLRSDSY